MSGSATFTIVMSSSSMNVPRQTASRVHHLFPRWTGSVPASRGLGGRPGLCRGELGHRALLVLPVPATA